MPSDLTESNDLTLDPKVSLTPEDHTQGSEHAGVTLLEYGDYQCPHCAAAAPVVKQLQRRFGEELRYAWRHFPLTEIHDMAEPAAETAEWAGANNRFWEMHDLLLANQEELDDSLLLELADQIGADDQDLSEALEQGAFQESVAADVESGEEAGVHGTPTFFINGVKHEGAWEFESLANAIERQLDRGRKRAA
jgi:protein-disulfide isomerase